MGGEDVSDGTYSVEVQYVWSHGAGADCITEDSSYSDASALVRELNKVIENREYKPYLTARIEIAKTNNTLVNSAVARLASEFLRNEPFEMERSVVMYKTHPEQDYNNDPWL